MPLTHACKRVHRHSRAAPSPTPPPTPSIPYAQLSFHLTCTEPPPRQHHHHSIIFMGRPFPLPPPPMCTQLTAHSATPTSLPDNTMAGHPIIIMHTLHAHSYTAVHSALCWQRCLSNVSVLMHSSHVSACYDYSIRAQTAEAGSPQVQRANKANEGESKRWRVTLLSHNDLEQKYVHEVQNHPEATIWRRPIVHPMVNISGQTKIGLELPQLSVVSQSLLLTPSITEGKQVISTYMSCWGFNKHLSRLCNLATVNQCWTISAW